MEFKKSKDIKIQCDDGYITLGIKEDVSTLSLLDLIDAEKKSLSTKEVKGILKIVISNEKEYDKEQFERIRKEWKL